MCNTKILGIGARCRHEVDNGEGVRKFEDYLNLYIKESETAKAICPDEECCINKVTTIAKQRDVFGKEVRKKIDDVLETIKVDCMLSLDLGEPSWCTPLASISL